MIQRRLVYLLILSALSSASLYAQQEEDALMIKSIHNHILRDGRCYAWLDTLTTIAPGRLAGSDAYSLAEDYMLQVLQDIGSDTTWKQACTSPKWKRGATERVLLIENDLDSIELHALALGNSVGTGGKWVEGEVIEVQGLEEVDLLGAKLNGKIVFYNRPMDPTQIHTFHAYGGAVDQRVFGASRAAAHGARAVIVRSMTTLLDTVPHTGVLKYTEDSPQIPALAISTLDAEILSEKIQQNPTITIAISSHAEILGDDIDHNIIGEIRGSEFPDEIILVGGHLDAWDVGAGAHDDGAGCVHALEVLNTLLSLGYQPKRTLRCVLFANEENGLAGGRTYARVADSLDERHLFALESDAGGFHPMSFSFDANADVLKPYYSRVVEWSDLFEPYGILFRIGGSGADIGPLKSNPTLLAGLRVNSQRYFDFHHTRRDQIEYVNERELKLGAAAMASLVYLVDKYGLEASH